MKFPIVDLSSVHAVFIDIDNTLYDYDLAHKEAMLFVYARYSKFNGTASLDFPAFNHLYRKARTEVTDRLLPQGSCRSRFLAFQLMFERLNLPRGYVLARECAQWYWGSLISHAKVYKEALSFLEKCKKMGIPVCAVTDMLAVIQVRKIEALGLVDLIQFVVSSEEVGEEKPSHKIFLKALEKVKCSPENVVMIGDSHVKDICGAKKLGIKAYEVIL